MATLEIAEFSSIAMMGGLVQPMLQLPPLAEQVVTFSTTTASATLNSGTGVVRLLADADCRVKLGAGTPTAASPNLKLKAGIPETFAVQGASVSGGLKIAVVAG